MEKIPGAGATSRYLFNVPALTVLICGGLQTLPLAAQSLDPAVSQRDTINISSGYFSKDYANNVDYAQTVLDESRAVERLSMLGYEKYADNLSSWGSRGMYFVGTNLVTMLSNLRLTYHEWGHASRTVAMGGTASFSNCLGGNSWCAAPRDFFGYAGSQLFHFGGGGATQPYGTWTANNDSGKAVENILNGGGVNNEMLVADKLGEQHFLRGTGSVFSQWALLGQQAIVTYGVDGPSDDMTAVASQYRSTGVDTQIQKSDLRRINQLSLISGSTVTAAMASYEFIVNGKASVKPWTVGGFLVPNQYNYISSRGITRKWVSGYEWDDNTKLLGSYEYVVRGDSFTEPGLDIYKNFGEWDALVKVSGKTMGWANIETAFSKRLNNNWKLTATAYEWDSRSLMGERNSLNLSNNKTRQGSIGVAYEY